MNQILGRELIYDSITQILSNFDAQCRLVNYKKGIYIYGSPGCGKTHFVMDILKRLNYDIIRYDAGDVRNKALIDTITCDNISNCNVLELMYRRTKKIAIVMDEIDGMNNGDKGGITQLIKLIRQKKTKKQKLENVTLNPIICIGNYNVDKKLKELMKVCHVFELAPITHLQMEQLLAIKIPNLKNIDIPTSHFLDYIQGDLRKLEFIQRLEKSTPEIFKCSQLLKDILYMKNYNDDAKQITKSLINKPVSIQEHPTYMNETDRTIISLLFHENIIDALQKNQTHLSQKVLHFYSKILQNICFADYIDRITFQNQIWVFNEMSSLIKTFYNNHLYHKTFPEKRNTFHPQEVRFTKVLTKYSTEYNNQLFIYNLCQELDMDKKDIIAFFQELRVVGGIEPDLEHLPHRQSRCDGCSECRRHLTMEAVKGSNVEHLFEDTSITKLDIKRMFRFLDKNVKCENLIEDIDD
jgi:hypothetical protein